MLAKHLVDLLQHRAAQTPDNLAYTYLKEGISPDGSLTYAELDRQARKGAAFIQRYVAVNGRVLLLYPPGIDFVIGFFACLYAGVIAIPAPPPDAARLKRTLPRLKAIAKDAEASLVLSSPELLNSIAETLADFPAEHWFAYTELTTADAEAWHKPVITEQTIAYLQYTSGSTSSPKGVMMSHGNLMHHLALIKDAWSYDANSISVTWMPYFHDYGLVDGLLSPLFSGVPCYILSPLTFLKRPLRWLQAISTYRGTHTQAPNFAYAYCLEKISDAQIKELDLSCLKVASNGAEPVRQDTIEQFSQRFSVCGFRPECLYPAYGLAEATLLVATKAHHVLPRNYTLSDSEQQDDKIQGSVVSCGAPIGTMRVAIVKTDNFQQCSDSTIGEIWLHDSSVAQGYWQNAKATDETFQAYTDKGEGPFLRTGDLGFLKNGELYVTGRLKDLIIIDGVNHYPQDIEWTVMQAHSAIRLEHVAAFSVEIDDHERLIVVAELVQSFENYQPVIQAIRTALAQTHELDAYAIVLLKKGTILKTSSGKLQRHACKRAFLHEQLEAHHIWQHGLRVAELNSTHTVESLQTWLISTLADTLNIATSDIEINQPFASYGLSSRLAVSIVGALEDYLGNSDLSPTLLWQYATITDLVAYLTDTQSLSQTQVERKITDTDGDIAIIGMACRFPDANSLEQFWQNLLDGHDAIKEIPATRWQVDQYPAHISRWAGLLNEVDTFDADFFGIAAKEADAMDPQQRLLLEVTYHALEHAGIASDSLARSDTGVFIGISTDDYAAWQFADTAQISAYAGSGKTLSIAANRLSYCLDLQGPSMAIDTACSSSLVAVHSACHSLRQHESSLALAGAVNLLLSPQLMIALSEAQMLSPTGHCKTFAADADGYVRGEGCGVVVLKRLADAKRDGDNILAIIRGSAVNQDGRSNGLTAPNLLAQQAVMRKALADANLKPQDISYIEAHGTGTPLGDPIEMTALQTVFATNPAISVGSVKTNIGHLEAAAGIAGLIKVVLALQHQTIPAQLYSDRAGQVFPINPLIKLAGTGFSIATQTTPWTANERIAGVSSFGFGGTNAHLIVAEAVKVPSPPAPRGEELGVRNKNELFVLSAKTAEATKQLAHDYANYLTQHPTTDLSDLCINAFKGRNHFAHRLALITDSVTDLQTQLLTPTVAVAAKTPQKIAFLFTGQGSQYAKMGEALYSSEAVFKAVIDECEQLLADDLPLPLTQVLFADNDAQLQQTAYTQPLLFVLQVALARLWQSWGVNADVLLGHSVGEFAAAHIAGIFDLKTALKLIAARGRLMQALPANGTMAVLFANVATVEQALHDVAGLAVIAAYNTEGLQVISGTRHAVAHVCDTLQKQGIRTQELAVSHAFHSPLMADMLKEFANIARSCHYAPATLPIISSVTGQFNDAVMSTPDYWVQHISHPVRFADAVQTLLTQSYQIAIEIGAQPQLLTMAQQFSGAEKLRWLPSLKRGTADRAVLLSSVAELYALGVKVDCYNKQTETRLSGLPTYPFQRQRYWLETTPNFAACGVTQNSNSCESPNSCAIQYAPVAEQQHLSLYERLHNDVKQTLGLRTPQPIDGSRGFFELGMDSLMAVQLMSRLEQQFGVKLPATLLFDYSNIEKLAAYLDALLNKTNTATVHNETDDVQAIEQELAALEHLLRDEQ